MITKPRGLTIYIFLLLLLNISSVNVSTALSKTADPPPPKSIFDVLSHSELLEVIIKTDLVQLKANQKREDYQEALFSYDDASGQTVEMNIKIRARGKYRRRACEFAPIKINFSKKDLKEAGLSSFDKLKLVTHCLDDKTESKDIVMREYLAYKLYSELTDQSLRVQLIKVTYLDVNTNKKIKNRYGFLIESSRELAARHNMDICDCMNTEDQQLHGSSESTNAFFQYMIGNTDYNVKMLRNVELMTHKETGKVHVVPYDFDFSGLVDAPYAIPNPDLKLVSLQQRVFLGLDPEKNKEQLGETLERFRAKRMNLYHIILSCKYLDKQSQKEIIDYMDSFYTDLEEKFANNSHTPKDGSIRPNSSVAGLKN